MLPLRFRLVLVNVLVFLLTLIILVSVLSGQILAHLYEQIDRDLAAISDRVTRQIVIVDGRPRLAVNTGSLPGDAEAKSFIRLLDSTGAILDGAGDFQSTPVTPKALRATERGAVANQRDANGVLRRIYTRPIYAALTNNAAFKVGYIQTATVPDEVLETIQQIRYSLLVGIPAALIVAILAGLFAIHKALQPLSEMAHSAAAISAESLSERRLPVPRPKDEVRELALSFNAMLDRLSAAFVQQKRFTADASHELRTPVTAILGQSELALRRARSPEAYQATLVRIRDEAQRMQRLIGRMLALARAEGGQQVLTFAATDVAALLGSLEDTLVPSDAVSNVRLRMDVPSEAVIVTDADILTQILLNLLENAIAYTEHGTVNVTLAMHTDTMQIQIRDNGPGIDPAHFTQIFQPFFRSDPARQRREGNVGLGLALTHELTHLIGGRIEAANHPEGGAVFTLTLPRRPTTHSAA